MRDVGAIGWDNNGPFSIISIPHLTPLMWLFSEAHPLCEVKLWTLIDSSHNKGDLEDVNLAIVEPNLPWSFPLDDISYQRCPINYRANNPDQTVFLFPPLKVQNILEQFAVRSGQDLCVGPVGHINFSPQTRARRCDNLIPAPRNVYVDNRGLIKEPNERFYEICTHLRSPFVINNDPRRSYSYDGEKHVNLNFPLALVSWIFSWLTNKVLVG